MYLCVCAGCLSKSTAWPMGPGREQDWALSHPLGSPGLVPAQVGLCRAEGTAWGHRGVFAHSPISEGEQFPLGSSSHCPADRHVSQDSGSAQIPAFVDLETEQMHSGRNLCKYFFFLSSPSLSAFLVGHEVPEGPVPALAVPKEHWQHHNTPRLLCHCSLMVLQPEHRENEVLI